VGADCLKAGRHGRSAVKIAEFQVWLCVVAVSLHIHVNALVLSDKPYAEMSHAAIRIPIADYT